MRHFIDLETEELRLLYASISTQALQWEAMTPIMEKMQRHLDIAKQSGN